MSTKFEAAARALTAKFGQHLCNRAMGGGADCTAWEPGDKCRCKEAAIAVLEAIWEPDEAMVEACIKKTGGWMDALAGWESMIDVLLAEARGGK